MNNPPHGHQFHILKNSRSIGPLSEVDIREGLASGLFSLDDMVREDGETRWMRLRQIVEFAPGAAEPAAPGWMELASVVRRRLGADLAEHPLALGMVAIAIGGVTLLLLTQWPAALWLLWFGVAVVIGIVQLGSGRWGQGAVLVTIPFAVALYILMRSVEPSPKPKLALQATEEADLPATPAPAPTARPIAAVKSTPAPTAAPTPTPTPVPVPTPKATLAIASTPTPVPAPPASALEPPPPPSPPTVPGLADASTPPPAPTPTPAPVNSAAPSVPPQLLAVINASATPTPSPTATTAPVTDNSKAQPTPAPDFVKQHRSAFIVVKGRDGAGSGFVCRMGGLPWVFTNAHVLAGARETKLTRLDNTQLTPGAVFAGGPRDIMRIGLAADHPTSLEVTTDFDKEVAINDEVEVIGNSDGADVVTTLKGVVVGLGADRVEVSAEFIPGNSGSPIIHTKTGKVIGIATYLTRRREQFSSDPAQKDKIVVRRFGYRIDNVTQWEPVFWAAFQADAERIRRIEVLTADILHLLRTGSSSGIETEALRRIAVNWLAIRNRPQSSEADLRTANTRLLSDLRSLVRADITQAEAQLRYSYFREQLKNERQIRDKMFEDFDKLVKQRTSTIGRMQ